MKVIKITLEDIHAIKDGWGLIKTIEEIGPSCCLDDICIISMDPTDAEIQKLVATKQLQIDMIEIPTRRPEE